MTIQHRTVDIEAASKLWKEDLSASQIAKCFGASQRHRRDHISKSRVLPFEAASSQLPTAREQESSAEGQLQCATAGPIPQSSLPTNMTWSDCRSPSAS